MESWRAHAGPRVAVNTQARPRTNGGQLPAPSHGLGSLGEGAGHSLVSRERRTTVSGQGSVCRGRGAAVAR